MIGIVPSTLHETQMMARLFLVALSAVLLASASFGPARAGGGYADGAAALKRQDYATAARILRPLAARGDARAQAALGYLYANGKGVPQDQIESAMWYRRASEQGNPTAQYMLGLMYDKGHGVPQDFVVAYMWLNLAVAGATERERDYWVKIRDAVAFKLNPLELREGQTLALEWQARRERWPARPSYAADPRSIRRAPH